MKYEYTGDVHRELVDSYRTDESPFPTDSSRTYPPREFLREEPPLLKQLLFPRCWNATELLDDPEKTHTRLTALGRCMQKGISAYSDHDADTVAAIVDRTLEELPAIRRALKKTSKPPTRAIQQQRATARSSDRTPGFTLY
nr:hypothetical protein [Halorhabdus sp. CBA1104]